MPETSIWRLLSLMWELHFPSHSLKLKEEIGLTKLQRWCRGEEEGGGGGGSISRGIKTKKLIWSRCCCVFEVLLYWEAWPGKKKKKVGGRQRRRRRRRRRRGHVCRRRDRSYDESRHVSPLNRVFLGFELAAAAAGIEFRCGACLRAPGPLQVEMLLSIRTVRAWPRPDPSHWWF